MHLYLATFLLALAMLALEIALTRILSVATYYHLAFLAISTAMLGMTVAATRIFLDPRRFSAERFEANLGRSCLGFAIATVVALLLLCLIPVDLSASLMVPLALACITAACVLPFYFAGIAITLVLTRSSLPVGFIYASDLLGASMGCLVVLAGMEYWDAPSLILLCAAIGAAAGAVYSWRSKRKGLRWANLVAAIALAALAPVNAQSPRFIRPLVVKGRVRPPRVYEIERWNSFSRIVVAPEAPTTLGLWGPSPIAPQLAVPQHYMDIDGDAGTGMRRFHQPADIEPLRYDVTNVAHAVRPHGASCVIGVGGGRDIQAAILFGHSPILGVEVNPIFVSLLKHEFRDFARIADRPEVKLVVDDARSYLSRSTQKFSLIQMSLIDTWAATGAGAMTLTENGLYTLEAWKVFLDRLEPDGLFTVSRWYDPDDPGETGRLLSLASLVLLDSGVSHPADHLALVASGPVATLILAKQPLGRQDLDTLEAFCRKMQFKILASPGQTPENPILRSILAARTPDDLYRDRLDTRFRLDPTTDEDPYFFNLLRLGDGLDFFAKNGLLKLLDTEQIGVIKGNLVAMTVLVALIAILTLLSALTVVVPLLLRQRIGDAEIPRGRAVAAGAFYFSLIGAGFMLLEMAMMQRLSIFLGHPVYGLGVVLCLIILSTGVGSFLSQCLPMTRTPWVYLYPVVLAATIVAERFVLSALMSGLVTAPMAVKIASSVAAICPVGILLGFCFPTGMRLVREIDAAETPWYWALNGIFGVLASALAVFISIYCGISTNFYLAAACYLLATICVAVLVRRSVPASTAIKRRLEPASNR